MQKATRTIFQPKRFGFWLQTAAKVWQGEKQASLTRQAVFSGTKIYEQNISDAVRDVCLGMNDVSEVISRGSPNFRAANKTFAIYQLNHHGDGRIALWLNSPPGAQKFYVEKIKPSTSYRPTSAPAAGSA